MLEHEFSELSAREFKQRAARGVRRGETLSLFECRCCLMASYGIDVTRREIRDIWLSLPTMACNSDEEILAHGLDLETYRQIAQAALQAAGVSESMLQNKVYEVFDRSRKGFVSQDDFARVLGASGRLHLSRGPCGQSVFHAVDDLQIQKISSTQVKSLVLGGGRRTVTGTLL